MTKIDLTPEAVERLAKRVSPVTDDVRTVTVFAATSREVAATLRALSTRLAEVEEALKLNQDLDAISVDAMSNLITRAEAAEAKLAQAVEALRWQSSQPEAHPFMAEHARAALAQIGGDA
jgi:hypothetical protein